MLTLLSGMGIPLTANDAPAAVEVRDDLRAAREWLLRA
jgi:hypothetical protein